VLSLRVKPRFSRSQNRSKTELKEDFRNNLSSGFGSNQHHRDTSLGQGKLPWSARMFYFWFLNPTGCLTLFLTYRSKVLGEAFYMMWIWRRFLCSSMLTTAPSESFKKQDIRLLCNQIAITVRLQNSLKIGLELYSFVFAICGRQFVLTVFKRALQAFFACSARCVQSCTVAYVILLSFNYLSVTCEDSLKLLCAKSVWTSCSFTRQGFKLKRENFACVERRWWFL